MNEHTALEIADKLDYWIRLVTIIHTVSARSELCNCGNDAAYILRQQHAEIERLSAINAALTAKSNSYVIENAWLTEKINRLTAEKFRRFNNEECWIHQRNGENHLDTLKCPVVISPEELLSMQAEISALTAERDAAIARASALTQHLERVIGEHYAPSDCYSSGPMFGDARDAICPACAALHFLSNPRASVDSGRARSAT